MGYHRPIPELTEEIVKRFWNHVDIRGPDDCWEWKGVRNNGDYGSFNILYITYTASRIAWTIKNVAHLLLNDEHRMITRLLSTSLRHGAPLNALVSQLTKCDGEVTAFSKAILRVLKKYITDEEYLEVSRCRSCQSKNLVMESGCLKCADCSYSACD